MSFRITGWNESAGEGIDLSEKRTKSVFDLHGEGRNYDVVVTVCGKEAKEKCPVFPGAVTRLNWPFDDPSAFEGTHEEKLVQAREVRELIREKIEAFAEVF